MIILIDDDKIMHLSWQLKAKKAQVNLKCFYSVQDFLNGSSNYNSDCTIYIDSELGNGLKGEIEAKKIFDLGYTKIYLSTGYGPEDFDLKSLPWITGIINKRPPF